MHKGNSSRAHGDRPIRRSQNLQKQRKTKIGGNPPPKMWFSFVFKGFGFRRRGGGSPWALENLPFCIFGSWAFVFLRNCKLFQKNPNFNKEFQAFFENQWFSKGIISFFKKIKILVRNFKLFLKIHDFPKELQAFPNKSKF